MSVAGVTINTKQADAATLLMRALEHPLRLRIISFIDKNRVVHVGKIYKSLKIDQSVASSQLGILREVGLVRRERKERSILYSVNYDMLAHIEKALKKFGNS